MNDVTLLAVLVLAPVAAGGVCAVTRNRILRTSVVVVTCLGLMAMAGILFARGAFTVSLEPQQADRLSLVATSLDVLILLYFVWIGATRRHALALLLAVAQLVPLAAVKLRPHAPHLVEPTFVLDRLALVMALVICLVGSLVCIYAVRYMVDHEHHLKLDASSSRQPRFFMYLLVFLGAMNGLVFANDLSWIYFFWEVTTFCCYQLIRHDGNAEAERNALRALWMNLVGGLAFAVAIALVSSRGSSLAMSDLLAVNALSSVGLLPVCLMCIAGLTKSAQVPFGGWLLGAMVAPTPVSALLHSSTMVKAGVYLVLRLSPAFAGTALSTTLAVFGAFVMIATAIAALMRTNAKSVLAYSTIGNLGLIVMCAGINTPLAISAGVALIVFHAVSKGLLFMCVGTIEGRIGSRDIEDMEGLLGRYPWLGTVTVLGALSMLAPPFGVLVAKWAALEAISGSASASSLLVTTMLVLGSAITIVFWVKWLGRLLSLAPTAQPPTLKSQSIFYFVPLTALALGIVGMSGAVAPLMSAMEAAAAQGSAQPALFAYFTQLHTSMGAFPVWPLAAAAGVVTLVSVVLLRVRSESIRPAYMCGENVEGTGRFYTLADDARKLELGGFYFGESRSEKWVTGTSTCVGVALLLLAIWVAR